MSDMAFSQPELVRVAKFSITALTRIQECRHPHTRLGFAYQLAFVRLANRFPAQEPLEMVNEISTYVSVQLDIVPSAIQLYAQQRRTIINHQQEICDYLQLRRFGESEVAMLEAFLFEEACRLEQTGPLLMRAKSFLQENSILFPADSNLRRLIAKQRQRVRRGLLKGEEIHALARHVAYGKQGVLTARDLEGQRHTSSCLTLIMACIIYWQAKEINRVLLEEDSEGAGVDLSLVEHISPIGWENIILYGEYVLNRNLVRV